MTKSRSKYKKPQLRSKRSRDLEQIDPNRKDQHSPDENKPDRHWGIATETIH